MSVYRAVALDGEWWVYKRLDGQWLVVPGSYPTQAEAEAYIAFATQAEA